MNSIYKSLAVFSLTVLVLTSFSCREKLDHVGNVICPTDYFSYDEKSLITDGIVDGELNLKKVGLNIKTTFSEKISWGIEIKSASGFKTYSGEGKSLNVWWYGNSNKAPMFQDGEECTLTLHVQCRADVVRKFKIKGKSDFSSLNPSFGVLIRDWDKHGKHDVTDTAKFSASDGWAYGDGSDKKVTFNYLNAGPSPAGGQFLRIGGESLSKVWYFGGTGFGGIHTGAFSQLSTKNPDSLWFNVYVRGSVKDEVESDVAFGKDDYKWNLRQKVDWEGWKMISVKLSSLVPVKNLWLESTKAESVDLQYGCAVQMTKGYIDYDFVIITVGEPFFQQ